MAMETEPALATRIWEFGWALVPYWWLVASSVIFAVEPMIEGLFGGQWKDRIEKYWPKGRRHSHFRWASIAALLVASFWAFDDVNVRNRALLRDVAKVSGERDETRRQLLMANPN